MINVKNEAYLKLFGKHLRKIRLYRHLSQEDLAYSANIPISQVGRIERGEINTTISTVNSIAKALDIPTKDLFDFEKITG